MRPCPSGFSVGNVQVTAGTLGSVVYDFLSYDARVKRAQGKTPARSDAWWVKLLDI